MKEDKNIEDLFRSSFEDFEVTPPVQVKGRIDRELDSGRYTRLWWIAGLLLLVSVGFSTWLFLKPVKESFKDRNVSVITDSEKQDEYSSSEGNKVGHTEGNKDNGSNSVQDQSAVQEDAAKGSGPEKMGQERNSIALLHKKKTVESIKNGKLKKTRKRSARKTGNGTGDVWGSSGTVLLSDSGGQQTGEGATGETKNTDKKNNPEQTAGDDNDSIAGKEQPAKADSSAAPRDETAPKEKLKKPKSGLWMASIYASPMFGTGLQSPKPLEELDEKSGFRFSAEVNRSLFGGYGVSTGVGYRSQSETYSRSYMSYDSIFAGYDSIPIYSGDTIIGYDSVAVYNIDSTKTTYSQANAIRTVFIPLYISRQFTFGDHWGMLVNAGTVFRFHTFKTGAVDSMLPAISLNKFSMSVVGRIHATYTFNQLVFSAGVSGGFDLKSPLTYGTTERRRYTLTPEIGIHFTF